jgi:hypothetical protein
LNFGLVLIKFQESILVKVARNKDPGTRMNMNWGFKGLTDLIKNEIKRIKSLNSQLRSELKKPKINDHFVRNAQIQESNFKIIGVRLKNHKW